MSHQVISMRHLIEMAMSTNIKPGRREDGPPFDCATMQMIGPLPEKLRVAVQFMDCFSGQKTLPGKENKDRHKADVKSGWDEIHPSIFAHFDLAPPQQDRIIICNDWTVAFKN